jgi:hypothetical protein
MIEGGISITSPTKKPAFCEIGSICRLFLLSKYFSIFAMNLKFISYTPPKERQPQFCEQKLEMVPQFLNSNGISVGRNAPVRKDVFKFLRRLHESLADSNTKGNLEWTDLLSC